MEREASMSQPTQWFNRNKFNDDELCFVRVAMRVCANEWMKECIVYKLETYLWPKWMGNIVNEWDMKHCQPVSAAVDKMNENWE